MAPDRRGKGLVLRHHFTQVDQIHQLVSASEADSNLGFMARTMALCSLPRTNPGNSHQYKRVNGPYKLVMVAGADNKESSPFLVAPRLTIGHATFFFDLVRLRLNLQLPPEGFAELWKMTVADHLPQPWFDVDERRRQPALPNWLSSSNDRSHLSSTSSLTDSKQLVLERQDPDSRVVGGSPPAFLKARSGRLVSLLELSMELFEGRPGFVVLGRWYHDEAACATRLARSSTGCSPRSRV